MRDIKTTDYVSEYSFKEMDGPKYQTSSLRSVEMERRNDLETEAIPRDSKPRRPNRKIRSKPVNRQSRLPEDKSKASRNDSKLARRGSVESNRSDGVVDTQKPRNPSDRRLKSGGNEILKKMEIPWRKNRKSKPSKKKDDRKKSKRITRKLKRPVKAAMEQMKPQEDSAWNPDSAWDYSSMSVPIEKGIKKGLEEVIQLVIKIVKAVVATTILPIVILMISIFFVVIVVVSLFSSDGSSAASTRYRSNITDPTDQQMVTEYSILMEYFDGEEIPVMAIMCSLYRESGFIGNNLEGSANSFWNVTDEEYTAAINTGSLSDHDFANHIYDGKHYKYWSKKDNEWKNGSCGYGIAQFTSMKQGLYDYAVKWFSDEGQGAGQDFNIADVSMQTNFLLYQIETDGSYSGLKDKLIEASSVEEASVWWVKVYEKPASNWETSGKSRAKDADWIKEKCESYAEQGYDQVEGEFIWPCPSSHTITSYFGNRAAPVAGASTDHKGIDIGGSEGDKVIASAPGVVKTVTNSSARGNYIVIDHGNGIETWYQHLSKQRVQVDDIVAAGDWIGDVGMTGISSGPHLHFEVHENGTPVDPLGYVK